MGKALPASFPRVRLLSKLQEDQKNKMAILTRLTSSNDHHKGRLVSKMGTVPSG